MESIKQTFDGTADFGGTVVATISRNGDLLHRMYLEHDATFTCIGTDPDENVGLVERYGDSLIKECEIEIGGQRIDKHTSMWNRVWSDLTEFNPNGHFGATTGPGASVPEGNGTLYQLMTGNGYGLNSESYNASYNPFGAHAADGVVNGFRYVNSVDGSKHGKITVNKIFLPLNFWFCRNPGLALPLIALQYHEVKVKMNFEALGNLARHSNLLTGDFKHGVSATVSTVSAVPEFGLWCDYIYLDTDERRRFAQVSHEYLIEQLQYSYNSLNSSTPSIDLNFNHPVKELIWCMRNTTVASGDGGRHQPCTAAGFGDSSSAPVSIDTMGGNWRLKLNGHDRFKERDTRYFTKTQVWQHHTGYGSLGTIGEDDHDLDAEVAIPHGTDAIAVYSFALKPEEHQPSGTCNFSRIDNAQLTGTSITVSGKHTTTPTPGIGQALTTSLIIFAVNYNVLRIMSGMGGLAYSN